MKRSLRGHRDALEDLRQRGLTDFQAGQYEQLIAGEEAKVKQLALDSIESSRADLMSRGSAALDQLTDTRAKANAVRELIAAGRTSPEEARRELELLRNGHTAAGRAREEFAQRAERIEEMEADPLAAGEAMLDNLPALWPDLDF